MKDLKHLEVWFLTGTQNLYGDETLRQVAIHSQEVAQFLDQAPNIPVKVIFKPILKSSEEIFDVIIAANSTINCIGIITWMHTFSPAKMWARGLSQLKKPMLVVRFSSLTLTRSSKSACSQLAISPPPNSALFSTIRLR